MTSSPLPQKAPVLDRLETTKKPTFAIPAKKINDGDDLNFFLSSTAYRDLTLWLYQLNRSMFPTKDSNGKITESTLASPPTCSPGVEKLRQIVASLSNLIAKAPPHTGPRRFGNVAFRDWFALAEEAIPGLIESHLGESLRKWDEDGTSALGGELSSYLVGSFGSKQRLDYGTGHELSFLAFLGCLWKLGVFEDGEERALVMGVVDPYLTLTRKLILTYTLEPAGSHGVWGLDDHSFAPYIFGSAQYGPAISPTATHQPVPTEGSLDTAPSPTAVANKAFVADYKDTNMYFAAIQFIYDVKTGPFWEHSPVLYDVSGIKDGWGKINKGMLKMYAAEVLGKFPVVQHFPFGGLFAWEQDEMAARLPSSVHALQQPPAVSKDVVTPPSSGGVGTAAPWARAGGGGGTGMGGMQSSTGMPTMRAPWAGGGGGAASRAPGRAPPSSGAYRAPATAAPWTATSRPAPSNTGMPSTAAPWAATTRPAPSGTGMPSTAAPWAKRDGAR